MLIFVMPRKIPEIHRNPLSYKTPYSYKILKIIFKLLRQKSFSRAEFIFKCACLLLVCFVCDVATEFKFLPFLEKEFSIELFFFI